MQNFAASNRLLLAAPDVPENCNKRAPHGTFRITPQKKQKQARRTRASRSAKSTYISTIK